MSVYDFAISIILFGWSLLVFFQARRERNKTTRRWQCQMFFLLLLKRLSKHEKQKDNAGLEPLRVVKEMYSLIMVSRCTYLNDSKSRGTLKTKETMFKWISNELIILLSSEISRKPPAKIVKVIQLWVNSVTSFHDIILGSFPTRSYEGPLCDVTNFQWWYAPVVYKDALR